MTVQDIKKAATNKGWSISEEDQMIGVEIRPLFWSWFKVWSDGCTSYNHTYSQRTGATCKNFRRGFAKQRRVMKAIA